MMTTTMMMMMMMMVIIIIIIIIIMRQVRKPYTKLWQCVAFLPSLSQCCCRNCYVW